MQGNHQEIYKEYMMRIPTVTRASRSARLSKHRLKCLISVTGSRECQLVSFTILPVNGGSASPAAHQSQASYETPLTPNVDCRGQTFWKEIYNAERAYKAVIIHGRIDSSLLFPLQGDWCFEDAL